MKDYSENRKAHLCKYAQDNNLPVGGKWKDKPYNHILIKKIENNKCNIERTVFDNLIKEIKEINNPFGFLDKLHIYARHLNSSQILCYNYFRPMLSDNRRAKEELVNLISEKITPITNDAECKFEYKPYENEGTEFDFYIKQDACKEIFFEIKYTENGFGKAKDDKEHNEKFESTYKSMIADCVCLKDKTNIPSLKFFNDYQLFRNVIRVTDKNKFSIFIFPKENENIVSSFERFKKCYISEEYSDNVKALYWEDLMKGKEETELFKKYFAED